MSSLFDPTAILNDNVEANATRRDPLPSGETIAQITKLDFAEGKAGPHAKNPGAPWARLDCKLEITDPEYLAGVAGQPEKAYSRLGIMLDMTDGKVSTGPNKNVNLGRLREAAGVNGKPLSMLEGQYIRIMIAHKPHPKDDGTPENEQYSGVVLDEVVSYTKAY